MRALREAMLLRPNGHTPILRLAAPTTTALVRRSSSWSVSFPVARSATTTCNRRRATTAFVAAGTGSSADLVILARWARVMAVRPRHGTNMTGDFARRQGNTWDAETLTVPSTAATRRGGSCNTTTEKSSGGAAGTRCHFVLV